MSTKKPSAKKVAVVCEEGSGQPDVIVDFVFDRGVFYLAVENIGSAPAYRVSAKFDREFYGLGGRQEMSCLPLFRRLEFLAPRKKIETLLDTSSAYFQRREPTRLTVTVAFRDARRRLYERRMVHDLSIYKDISYVLMPAGTSAPVVPEPQPAAALPATEGVNYVRLERAPLH